MKHDETRIRPAFVESVFNPCSICGLESFVYGLKPLILDSSRDRKSDPPELRPCPSLSALRQEPQRRDRLYRARCRPALKSQGKDVVELEIGDSPLRARPRPRPPGNRRFATISRITVLPGLAGVS